MHCGQCNLANIAHSNNIATGYKPDFCLMLRSIGLAVLYILHVMREILLTHLKLLLVQTTQERHYSKV